jgi:hypothetical protein
MSNSLVLFLALSRSQLTRACFPSPVCLPAYRGANEQQCYIAVLFVYLKLEMLSQKHITLIRYVVYSKVQVHKTIHTRHHSYSTSKQNILSSSSTFSLLYSSLPHPSFIISLLHPNYPYRDPHVTLSPSFLFLSPFSFYPSVLSPPFTSFAGIPWFPTSTGRRRTPPPSPFLTGGRDSEPCAPPRQRSLPYLPAQRETTAKEGLSPAANRETETAAVRRSRGFQR